MTNRLKELIVEALDGVTIDDGSVYQYDQLVAALEYKISEAIKNHEIDYYTESVKRKPNPSQ